VEVDGTIGFRVSDAQGSHVGTVESPLYGNGPDVPDALAVRSGHLLQRHYIVPANAIRTVDRDGHLIQLRLDRGRLLRFL
jgi:uncharacterized protein YrrD